jgi:hypothetical protein
MELDMAVSKREIYGVLNGLLPLYSAASEAYRDQERKHVPRTAFNIILALAGRPPGEVRMCDLGGGLNLFAPAVAALGAKEVILVDDFGDRGYAGAWETVLPVHGRLGVKVVSRDLVSLGLSGVIAGQVNVFTCFEFLEHCHHSPKKLLREAASHLVAGGLFVISVPNCVNLRKRLTVPLGFGRWTRMEDWYEPEVFRGHVREPSVDDLKYIARDLGLRDTRIHGRNWSGYYSPRRTVRWLTGIFDLPLRLFPGLCSHIYLVGRKGA